MELDPARVVVIEDSHIGLTSAKAAGMNCLVRCTVVLPFRQRLHKMYFMRCIL